MSRNIISIKDVTLKRLKDYNYPGNVRELENMIERAIVVGNGKEILPRDLPLDKKTTDTSYESLEDLEKKYIANVLDKYEWNISKSARVLKVDRVTLYNKIRKYGLTSPGKS